MISRRPSLAVSLLLAAAWLTSLVMAAAPAEPVQAAQAAQQAPAAASTTPRQVLNQYCVTCHNSKVKTAGLALDTVDPTNVGEHGAIWEKVVHKLRTGAMPPAGARRPDRATFEALRATLENELDRAAAAAPNPGRLPAFQRLTRTEYRNAIRDLLALDELPPDMDVALLLPADNSASGFDNLRDLLFVSSTQLEQYLSAARKISRLAVGDQSAPLLVDHLFRVSAEMPQDYHIEGTPFGARGGIVIRTNIPLDGDYQINIALTRQTPGHEFEVSVDGERVQLFSTDAPPAVDVGAGRGNFRFPVTMPLKAGPREIIVTFLPVSAARSQELARPMLRNLNGRQPGVEIVSLKGPMKVAGAGDSPSRRRLFVCRPQAAADETPCAKQILSTLLRRAFRRPVADLDVRALMPFYEAGRAESGFEMGIERALERVLVSPQFLFRIEADPEGSQARLYRISDVALASRLSFFLWSSIPDDALLDVAAQGKLRDPNVLEQQVQRMLRDDRSRALVDNFAAQWLFLRDVPAKNPSPMYFRDFDAGLKEALKREVELFVDSILRDDRSVLDLLNANHTFVNERLAKHYGIPGVYGSHFRRVTLGEDSPRLGLLGKAAILTVTSYASRTSPVLRGKYVLDNLLNAPPPPPPPNIPPLQEKSDSGKPLSMREAMVQHRGNPACAGCHARMDPLGLALENFDAVGRWRTYDASGKAVDASAVLADGTRFDGVAGLRQQLLSQPEQFVTGMTEKFMTYAIGRNVDYYDAPAVRKIVREMSANNYRFSSMVLGIVNSLPFQMRKAQAPAEVSASR
jgi:mono/diheme cytochrome c family protein